jgi:hypothetical protein
LGIFFFFLQHAKSQPVDNLICVFFCVDQREQKTLLNMSAARVASLSADGEFDGIFGDEGAQGYGECDSDNGDCGTAVIGGGPGMGDLFVERPKAGAPAWRGSRPPSFGFNGAGWGGARVNAVDGFGGTPISGELCGMFGATGIASPMTKQFSDSLPESPTTPMPTPSADDDAFFMALDAPTPTPAAFAAGFSRTVVTSSCASQTNMYFSVDLSQNRLYQKRMQRRRQTSRRTNVGNQH